ncbi:TonB-dependent receptor domain-containing protein [Flavobacterium sp.]|uniref:TonB-dependent receptor n=1 Tax=Flavobacterium sp. TaxID=239 RepID=UPI00286CDFED|nr:TonB-dependent receptor [Flavobacterium sp.]
MLKKLILSFLLLICNFVYSQYKVSGKILDENSNPIEDCHIHIANKNVSSNSLGEYVVKNLSKGKIKIFISSLGFKSIEETIILNANLVYNVKMTSKVNSLQEVFITKKKNTENNSILEQKIKTETIEKYSNQTLGDALKEVAGVTILRTGSNIVKPVINGLHSSRVPVISNNVRLEDQQWGAEHAPNFDINAAGKITIIKGASGLQYGGDAVGGLVIIEPLIVKKDTLFGKTIANVSTNGRGGTLSSSIHKGNFCDWSWNALGTFKYYGDRNAANYVLSNSGNRELNFSGDVKFTGKKYDASVFYSLYNAKIGILSASHTGSTNDLYNSINNQIPSVINDFTYNLNSPKQDVKHHLAKFNFNYLFNENASLSFQYSYQLNKRLEFDVRRKNFTDLAALDLELITHTVKVDYKLEAHDWNFKTGLNAEKQDNTASLLTGIRPLIPDYIRNDFGLYGILNYNISESLTFDTGIRYDFSDIEASKFYLKTRWTERGYDKEFSNFIIGENESGNQWFTKPKFTFHNVSASIGIHKQLDQDWNWYINGSLATRNPNPSEFFSDGLHHSTGQIELGDLGLKKEQSYKLSTTVQKKWSHFSVEINPYINSIHNYMFLKPFGFETTIRGAFPVWEYEQTNALLSGMDFHTVWDFSKNWKHQFSFASVTGIDNTNDEPLIAMPPLNFSNKIQFSKKEWNGLQLELKNEVVLQQTQFPNNNFLTKIIQNNELVDVLVDISSPPKAYQLLDFYSEMKFKTFRNGYATLAFSVQNILNTNYRDYLNSQRYFVDELGRNFQIQLKINY